MHSLNLAAHVRRLFPSGNYTESCLYSVLLRHVENYSTGTEKTNPKQKQIQSFEFLIRNLMYSFHCLLTTCNKLDGTVRLVAKLSQKMIQS